LQNLQRSGPKTKEDSVATMLALAKQDFPAALYVVGKWEIEGDNSQPKDASGGLAKIQKAADKNYGPAIYAIAMQSINDSPRHTKTWERIRLAATLGSQDAQYFLGDHYQRGEVVEQNSERAKGYFRLCAARGNSDCQFRLGRLMFNAPNRPDYEYEQALAWFQLAGEQGVSEAAQIVEREKPNLTAAQQKAIDILARQFAGKFN
jgi:TPR repeat protein